MKQLLTILSMILLTGVLHANAQCCATPCSAEAGTKSTCAQDSKSTTVKAYYFHATQRCVTCLAVEDVTKKALKEMYGDKVAFESINNDKKANKSMMEKFQVSGQALIIVNGDKITDLTNEAFLNARTNPAKLKAKIKEAIDPII